MAIYLKQPLSGRTTKYPMDLSASMTMFLGLLEKDFNMKKENIILITDCGTKVLPDKTMEDLVRERDEERERGSGSNRLLKEHEVVSKQ